MLTRMDPTARSKDAIQITKTATRAELTVRRRRVKGKMMQTNRSTLIKVSMKTDASLLRKEMKPAIWQVRLDRHSLALPSQKYDSPITRSMTAKITMYTPMRKSATARLVINVDWIMAMGVDGAILVSRIKMTMAFPIRALIPKIQMKTLTVVLWRNVFRQVKRG